MLLVALLARPRILGASINRGLRGERVLARDRISTSAAPRALSLSLRLFPSLSALDSIHSRLLGRVFADTRPFADRQRRGAEIP